MFSSTMGALRPAFPPIWVPKYDIFPSLQVKLVLVAFLCRHVINKTILLYIISIAGYAVLDLEKIQCVKTKKNSVN